MRFRLPFPILFFVVSLLAFDAAHAGCLSRIYASKIVATVGLSTEGAVARAITAFSEKTETAKLLEEAYAVARKKAQEGENFVSALTRALRVNNVDSVHDSKVPETGSLVFIGNHPFGLVDGISAYEFLDRNRPGEVMGLATTAISDFMPEFSDHMALIDNSIYPDTPQYKAKRDEQTHKNAKAALKALKWLKSGKVLCFFPAGLTSRRVSVRDAQAVDRPWKKGAAFFSRMTESPVMFMHTEGSNSRLSDVLSWLGEDIPLLARAWETRIRAESGFTTHISDPIYYNDTPLDLNDSLRTGYLLNEFLSFVNGEASWQQ